MKKNYSLIFTLLTLFSSTIQNNMYCSEHQETGKQIDEQIEQKLTPYLLGIGSAFVSACILFLVYKHFLQKEKKSSSQLKKPDFHQKLHEKKPKLQELLLKALVFQDEASIAILNNLPFSELFYCGLYKINLQNSYYYSRLQDRDNSLAQLFFEDDILHLKYFSCDGNELAQEVKDFCNKHSIEGCEEKIEAYKNDYINFLKTYSEKAEIPQELKKRLFFFLFYRAKSKGLLSDRTIFAVALSLIIDESDYQHMSLQILKYLFFNDLDAENDYSQVCKQVLLEIAKTAEFGNIGSTKEVYYLQDKLISYLYSHMRQEDIQEYKQVLFTHLIRKKHQEMSDNEYYKDRIPSKITNFLQKNSEIEMLNYQDFRLEFFVEQYISCLFILQKCIANDIEITTSDLEQLFITYYVYNYKREMPQNFKSKIKGISPSEGLEEEEIAILDAVVQRFGNEKFLNDVLKKDSHPPSMNSEHKLHCFLDIYVWNNMSLSIPFFKKDYQNLWCMYYRFDDIEVFNEEKTNELDSYIRYLLATDFENENIEINSLIEKINSLKTSLLKIYFNDESIIYAVALSNLPQEKKEIFYQKFLKQNYSHLYSNQLNTKQEELLFQLHAYTDSYYKDVLQEIYRLINTEEVSFEDFYCNHRCSICKDIYRTEQALRHDDEDSVDQEAIINYFQDIDDSATEEEKLNRILACINEYNINSVKVMINENQTLHDFFIQFLFGNRSDDIFNPKPHKTKLDQSLINLYKNKAAYKKIYYRDFKKIRIGDPDIIGVPKHKSNEKPLDEKFAKQKEFFNKHLLFLDQYKLPYQIPFLENLKHEFSFIFVDPKDTQTLQKQYELKKCIDVYAAEHVSPLGMVSSIRSLQKVMQIGMLPLVDTLDQIVY